MEKLLRKVNTYIAEMPFDREPAAIYEPIRYMLSLGGKRIRPMLMLLAYSLYRDNPENIMPQAVALETYHNFTLMHDDLMDNADMRRGKPTVHRRWDASMAVRSGDSMMILAYKLMLQCSKQHERPLFDMLTETALLINEGQQLDMEFETRYDVTEEEYLSMIRLKTSALLACALKTGAILADAPTSDQQMLYEAGEQFGFAFQLQDDLLDVYGDQAVFGKAIGGDIAENKKTYLLINALNRAAGKQREELLRWMAATSFDRQEKIQAVTDIYDQLGIRQLCEERIAHYFDLCHDCLDKVSVADSRKQPLLQYIDQMIGRNL